MNAGTQTARSAPLSFVAANEDQTKDAGFPVDFQNLCAFAMDQALGIEKASMATVVSLNSCVLDIYQESLRFNPVFGNLSDLAAQAVACSIESWFRPVFGNLFDLAAQAVACSIELQMN